MIIVRTARQSDLDSVLALAESAYPGMTTLPPDRRALADKIEASIVSVERQVAKPDDETYLLVMEDTEKATIVGTAGIIACLGVKDEFYSYKLNKVTHSNKALNKKITVETLNLTNHFEGFAEVATLYLSEDYRRNGNGKLLARSRYLFMAQFRQRFPESVMADLRGTFDEQGKSPFWEAVGRHFFDMEFAQADLYGALNGNQFIADLMPKYPIYVNLLSAEAQQAIGSPNEKGKAATQMLLSEGFAWNGHVDIFDASPSVDTRIDDIATVKQSRCASVRGATDAADTCRYMVATGSIDKFAVCYSPLVLVDEGGVLLPETTFNTLGLAVGDVIRFAPLALNSPE